MRAHVDQGVQALGAQPKVEGDIGMAWGARQVVIIAVAAGDLTTFGLQRDQGIAAPGGGEVESAVLHRGVSVGGAPGDGEVGAQGVGKGGEGHFIVCEGPGKGLSQRLRQGRARRDAVTRAGEVGHQRLNRGRRVKAHGMGHLMRPTGVGGQDDSQVPVSGRGVGKAVPMRDPLHNGGDPARIGTMGKSRELQVRVALAGGLVADKAREQATVHLGQDDMHRQVGRRQTPV